jgi:hypothetical protein
MQVGRDLFQSEVIVFVTMSATHLIKALPIYFLLGKPRDAATSIGS